MSLYLNSYIELTAELLKVRERNNDQESDEEDAILDSMDMAWLMLKPDERAKLIKI